MPRKHEWIPKRSVRVRAATTGRFSSYKGPYKWECKHCPQVSMSEVLKDWELEDHCLPKDPKELATPFREGHEWQKIGGRRRTEVDPEPTYLAKCLRCGMVVARHDTNRWQGDCNHWIVARVMDS